MFKLKTKFTPTGDQPQAINLLTENLKAGIKHQVLLGVTGSGKTFGMASVIERLPRPVLIISPNKTLAAQLYQEFKEFFPKSGVHYFVSYYDYYQPEAYIPQTDTYIEKDADINEKIDRLRHAAVQDLLSRKDVIIVASVSCIYNIGSPQNYQKVSLDIKAGQKIKRGAFISHLNSLQYLRNDFDVKPGTFRVRGDVVDIYLVTGQKMLRVEFDKNRIDKIRLGKVSPLPEYKIVNDNYKLFPAHFWATLEEKLPIATQNIRLELQQQIKKLKDGKKLLEAQRLTQRTNYDLEMILQTGVCSGIENYSRHLEFRKPGAPPFALIDYFPKDFLIFIDESHQTLPQIHAMSNQDRARKQTLIEHGFRLPSALDNRPLTFNEFEKRINQVVYVSATPGREEKDKTLRQAQGNITKKYVVEQLIRPTGLLEPSIEIRPTENQVRDLVSEIKKRSKKKQRVLAITLTKRLAEALSDYLMAQGISCQWLHSEVKTLKRPQILQNLRAGKYDVLVGINLLREGLDLPEVSLVAILDADKEGFLRSETTLIQTMGRAARHTEGHVILYADKETRSMKGAISEIERRRNIQMKHNKSRGIKPQSIEKAIRDWPFTSQDKGTFWELGMIKDKALLEKEMKQAAKNLNFERAAEIRDLIKKLK